MQRAIPSRHQQARRESFVWQDEFHSWKSLPRRTRSERRLQMSKLLRPYIPLRVRCIAALRQLGWGEKSKDGQQASIELLIRLHWPDQTAAAGETGHGRLLATLMQELAQKFGCAVGDLQLHHRPALENREQQISSRDGVRKIIGYFPDANDPEHLFYIDKQSHHIETHVRGVGALRSDAGEHNHQKALDRNRGLIKRKPKAKIRCRGFGKQSRPFPKGRGFEKRS
jgi:hypothetical protein